MSSSHFASSFAPRKNQEQLLLLAQKYHSMTDNGIYFFSRASYGLIYFERATYCLSTSIKTLHIWSIAPSFLKFHFSLILFHFYNLDIVRKIEF